MLSRADTLATACALAWAIALLFFRRLPHISGPALNLFKNTLASSLLVLTMLALQIGPSHERSWSDWLTLICSGVIGLAIADGLFFAGLRRIDASLTAVIDCAYAPTVFLLSTLVLGEEASFGLLLGGPLVLLGLALASWERKGSADRAKAQRAPVDRVGVMLTAAGVICTAIGIVVAKPVLTRSGLVEATTMRTVAGTLALYVVHLFRGDLRATMTLFRPQRDWRFAIPGTLFGTYLSMLLWLGGMSVGNTARTAILNQMGAVFLLFFSHLLGDRAPKQRWLGAGLAISGAMLVVAL